MLACAVWSIACAMLRSPSGKSKSSQISGNAYIPASVGEEYWQRCGWCGGEDGDGKEYYYPKADPQIVRMCKSPVFGRGGIEAMRSSAEREVEQPPGSRETTLDSRVRRAHRHLSHFRLPGRGFVSFAYTDLVHPAVVAHELQPKTCKAWPNGSS